MATIRASQSITFTDLYDASGFEYIYTKTISSIDDAGDFLSSQLPSDSWTYGLPSPDGGTDGISWSTSQGDLSQSFPVLWQCRRYVNGNPSTGDSVPAQWEVPTRIAIMGAQGAQGLPGPQGDAGLQGEQGPQGPDGPQGPAKIPKPGTIRAAQKTGAVIIPVAGQSTRRWSFKNWDTFYLTKPFAKTYLFFGEPLTFSKEDAFEDCSLRLKKSLDDLENKVNKNVGLVKDN